MLLSSSTLLCLPNTYLSPTPTSTYIHPCDVANLSQSYYSLFKLFYICDYVSLALRKPRMPRRIISSCIPYIIYILSKYYSSFLLRCIVVLLPSNLSHARPFLLTRYYQPFYQLNNHLIIFFPGVDWFNGTDCPRILLYKTALWSRA